MNSVQSTIDKPIFLTGFMGTGKSRIGSLLARRLQREFIDTDRLIEKRARKSIAQIFAEDGEEAFRQLEHQCVRTAANQPRSVTALGGGAIVAQRNWDLVRRSGVLVCLEADVEVILARVSRREDRPLLAGLSQEEKRAKINRLLDERRPYYQRADVQFHTSDSERPESAADKLITLLEHWYADRRRSA